MAQAPGTNITVTANASNQSVQNRTGTWFALGVAAGPANVPVPVQSMNDFNAVFGQTVNGQVTGRYSLTNMNSTLLYDALDTYFREGGMQAFVVRIQPTSTGVAATSASLGGVWTLTAAGKGTWANATQTNPLTLTVNYISAGNFSATITYNGNVNASVTGLSGDTDVVNWVNSLPVYQSLVTASSNAGTSTLPTSSASPLVVTLTGGTDVAVTDADVTAALASITEAYGPGQVSYPGNTNAAVYVSLANHAAANNRVALLHGGVATATATTLQTTVSTFQANTSVTDPSYAAFFAPWLITPGTVNTNPSATNPYAFTRTVAPCALAAAKIAQADAGHDANVPAAGIINGAASFVTGLSTSFVASDRAALNTAGVNVIRTIPNTGTIAVYGFRSAAVNPAWIYFSNVRFRMQIIEQFDTIAEAYVFQEIDGKGQLFAALAGALGAQCQAYWLRGSLYGANAGSAYVVNTGPTVNTPATIAAGQINAVVSLKMSPYGEFVNIAIAKYSVNAALPQ